MDRWRSRPWILPTLNVLLTAALGVAVNFATDLRTSWMAWVVVLGLALTIGLVTVLLERRPRGAAPERGVAILHSTEIGSSLGIWPRHENNRTATPGWLSKYNGGVLQRRRPKRFGKTSAPVEAVREMPDNAEPTAQQLVELGALAQRRGASKDAEALYRQSLAIAEELGNASGVASAQHQLGILAQLRGDLDEAEHRYRQSLAIAEQIGDQSGIAAGLGQLGVLAQSRGDYEEAKLRYGQVLELSEGVANTSRASLPQYGSAAFNLGVLLREQGDIEGAEAAWRRADERGDPTPTFNLGVLLREQGDIEGAEAALRRARQRGLDVA